MSGAFRSARLVVAGVGLIGGSFACALRRAGAVGRIVGVGRSASALERALQLGVIDEASTDLAAAVAGADFVLLAAPVGQYARLLGQLAGHLPAQAVLTDAGSTKRDVAASFARLGAAERARAVPGHPIAGAEKSGVEAARADLFDARRVVLTPLPDNDPGATARVRAAWEACGASVDEMSADQHDRVFAAVSHLPHLLAYALVHELAGRADARLLLRFAAGGFRDFTRIAASHPEMWRDIFAANRDALLAELNAYQSELEQWRALLERGDDAALEGIMGVARDARRAWADGEFGR